MCDEIIISRSFLFYLIQYNTIQTVSHGSQFIDVLRCKMNEGLKRETDLIDSQTKLSAQKKLNAMFLKVGYPEFILSQNPLDDILIIIQNTTSRIR